MMKKKFLSQIKQSKTLRIVVISVVFALGPFAYYIFRFHDYPLVKNPSELGTFGDFIGGTTNVILGLVNIALVAYIAISLGDRERNTEKMRLLFDISRHWNSEELMQCRTKADALLREHPNATLTELDNRYTDKAAPLWVVLRFFQDLQKAIDRDIIDTRETVEWFGRDFVWWDIVGVKEKFPVNWDHSEHWLRFSQSVNKSNNNKSWIEEARKILSQYQGNHLPPPSSST